MRDILELTVSPRNAALIEMQRWLGLRISEVMLLRTTDVARSLSAVNDVIWAWQPKTKTRRRLEVCGALKAALCRYLAWQAGRGVPFAPTRPLFWSPRNPRLALTSRQARRIVQAAAARAGCSGRIGTHSLRKTAAESVYERTGFDIKAVQLFLGHQSVASTGRYVGFLAEKKAWRAIQELGAVKEERGSTLFEMGGGR